MIFITLCAQPLVSFGHLPITRMEDKLMKVKKILVGYDFSNQAQAALERACHLARLFSAHLHVVHVVPSALLHISNYLELNQSLEKRLGETVEKAAHFEKAVKWKSVVLEGVAHHVLTKQAVKEKADLIVVASHNHGVWERLLLGSVAEKLLRHSPCSVLLHRGREVQGFKKILAPVDLSKVSSASVKTAAQWAKTFSAELLIAYAIDLRTYIPLSEFNFGIDMGKELDILSGVEGNRFDAFVAKMKKSISTLSQIEFRAEVLTGAVSQALVECAHKEHHDLILLAAHNESLGKFFLGSVADSVARYAPCSVLLLKDKK